MLHVGVQVGVVLNLLDFFLRFATKLTKILVKIRFMCMEFNIRFCLLPIVTAASTSLPSSNTSD